MGARDHKLETGPVVSTVPMSDLLTSTALVCVDAWLLQWLCVNVYCAARRPSVARTCWL